MSTALDPIYCNECDSAEQGTYEVLKFSGRHLKWLCRTCGDKIDNSAAPTAAPVKPIPDEPTDEPNWGGKKYLGTDVYTETRRRIAWVFDNFDRIYLSFSGGKDSGVLLNLALQHMEETGETRKLGIQILDNEAKNYWQIKKQAEQLPTGAGPTSRIAAYIETWERRCYPDSIPDDLSDALLFSGRAPSWKAIAICLLQNDFRLHKLGYTTTPGEWARAAIQVTSLDSHDAQPTLF